ncbi:MAG: carbohydrate ABC transporter substrate-binding protein [Ruminococcus sp.]|uniref:carbohydrate ABC transporter substrate-binding protein n=1 Tax=Ruminococcus sp. TaxID=41978 RepID=UPI001B577B5E|nr:carbohydrate ABC transporter substrate-binding protein [Ruminococcus sp.]MBP5579781.1 carbohydrate ABC transporter substrate-binding protein [Ruminococcus sp.]
MKKALSVISALAILASLTACNNGSNEGNGGNSSNTATTTKSGGDQQTTTKATGNDGTKEVINIWSFTDEVPNMLKKFLELNPDIAAKYSYEPSIIPTTDGAYQPALDKALQAGGKDAPDIYCAEAAFVVRYTQGDMKAFAKPYKDLGIDVDGGIAAAKTADYAVKLGTRDNSDVVALNYQATGGAFIYRRSIAKDVFGSDERETVEKEIGSNSGNWDKFFEAAEKLKNKGYGIISGDGDLWHAVENSSDAGWVVDGKLHIDQKRENFLDLSMKLKENQYHNDTEDWQEPWKADMRDEGPKKIFGYFGPAWLINYTLAENSGSWKDTGETDADGNPIKELDTSIGTYGDWAICNSPVGFFWGGTWLLANKDLPESKKEAVAKFFEWVTLDCTKDGLQYMWANGTFNGPGGTKDAVSSTTVMEMSDGKLDFLGGQNMFDVFVPANDYADGSNLTQYDEKINSYWRDQVRQYTSGQKTRDQAIKDFKTTVSDNLGLDVE